jgi:hypothetical protein
VRRESRHLRGRQCWEDVIGVGHSPIITGDGD